MDRPLAPSVRGSGTTWLRELRDPCIFRNGASSYLLYSVAGKKGIAIALLSGVPSPRVYRMAAATGNVGTVFGWRDVGQVRPGYNADLLMLDADPTLDIANAKRISRVMLAGVLIDREALLHGGR